MVTCIYLGPSAPDAEAKKIFPDAHFLPPAQQGDIASGVARYSPSAIGIIDGYFQQRPSVWHKEILWALSEGTHVFGAASMGALRAAELKSLGMVGIGRVFDGYCAGALPPFDGLCDDDEVAVVHGPGETGYLAVTDALVNIRFTLDAARKASVIDERSAAALLEHAQSLHFSVRTYPRVLQRARDASMSTQVLDQFEHWLSTGKVDQKRIDALMLVNHLQDLHERPQVRHQACFRFETTEIWSSALEEMLALNGELEFLDPHHQGILDELRCDGAAYQMAKREALPRLLVNQNVATLDDSLSGSANHPGQDVGADDENLRRQIDAFRQAHELWDREDVDRWLKVNDLELDHFETLMRNETRLASLAEGPLSLALANAMIDHLRLDGTYGQLSARVREKARIKSARTQELSGT